MSHRVSSDSLSPRTTRVTTSRFGDSGYNHPPPVKATLIGTLRKAMNGLSASILNTYFPAFSHKNCGKNTFSLAVREILKKDLWDEDSPVQFVPDGWIVNKRRREFCILEIEDTNPVSETKRDTIGRLMWWLDDNLWHLHLIRVNASSMAFFFMNCDDVAAWTCQNTRRANGTSKKR
jgi:hypothetical protein